MGPELSPMQRLHEFFASALGLMVKLLLHYSVKGVTLLKIIVAAVTAVLRH